MSSSKVILDDLIRSYHGHREREYKARAEQHKASVAEQKERDKNKILDEQKDCAQSIRVFKDILEEYIVKEDPRSRTFRKIIQCLANPIVKEHNPLYKSFGINKGNYCQLLKFGKELLAQDQFDKALHLFRVLTYLDQSNTEARLGLALVFLLNNNIDDALACAWKAHINDPKNIGPALCTLMCLEQKGDWEEASLLVGDLEMVKSELSRPTRKLIEEHAKLIDAKGGKV